jgi:uncharacterized OB-fold protein
MPTPPKRQRVPAIEGWLRMDGPEPCLIGTRCRKCGATFFPRETAFCRNPACDGGEFDDVELSRRGRLWSFTDNRYKPPAPYVSPEPFEPYAIAAVELAAERIVVLGQVVAGVSVAQLKAGMEMELVAGALYSDDANEYVVWKWRPVTA